MSPLEVENAVAASLALLGRLLDYLSFLKAQHGLTGDQIAAHAAKQFAENAAERQAILAALLTAK